MGLANYLIKTLNTTGSLMKSEEENNVEKLSVKNINDEGLDLTVELLMFLSEAKEENEKLKKEGKSFYDIQKTHIEKMKQLREIIAKNKQEQSLTQEQENIVTKVKSALTFKI